MATDKKEHLFKSGMIILDTNILLSLYRQSSRGSEQLLEILNAINERLWIPDHVVWEFIKNRPNVIYGQDRTSDALMEYLLEIRQEFNTRMSKYSNRVIMDPLERKERREEVDKYFDKIVESVKSIEVAPHRTLENDEIIERLERILDGRLGEAGTHDEYIKWGKEFKDRKSKEIPPGYKDADKGSNSDGDLIIWKQILKEAGSGGFPNGAIYVTGDKKEDLYRIVKGKTLGPRPEMIREFSENSVANEKFWQVDLNEFIVLASRLLSVDVDDVNTSLDTTERVPRRLACGSWDPDSYVQLIETLTERGYGNQAEVIKAAAINGGFVSRAEIYAICGFNQPRRLNGFSQPVVRIYRELLNPSGNSSVQMDLPMNARYFGPGKTIGYEVPLDFSFFECGNFSGWVEWDSEDPEYLNDPIFLELVNE